MIPSILLWLNFDATAKSPKNAAKTTATLQNRGGKVLLTLASTFAKLQLIIAISSTNSRSFKQQ
jgi:hypothetical protein